MWNCYSFGTSSTKIWVVACVFCDMTDPPPHFKGFRTTEGSHLSPDCSAWSHTAHSQTSVADPKAPAGTRVCSHLPPAPFLRPRPGCRPGCSVDTRAGLWRERGMAGRSASVAQVVHGTNLPAKRTVTSKDAPSLSRKQAYKAGCLRISEVLVITGGFAPIWKNKYHFISPQECSRVPARLWKGPQVLH